MEQAGRLFFYSTSRRQVYDPPIYSLCTVSARQSAWLLFNTCHSFTPGEKYPQGLDNSHSLG